MARTPTLWPLLPVQLVTQGWGGTLLTGVAWAAMGSVLACCRCAVELAAAAQCAVLCVVV